MPTPTETTLRGPNSAVPEDAPELHELLTVEEVAELFKVSKSWVYEHTRTRGGRSTARDERLPHIRVGSYLRFDARAVRMYLARQSRTA